MNTMKVGRCFANEEFLLAHRNVHILGGWVFAPYVPILVGISTLMGQYTRRAWELMDLYFIKPCNFLLYSLLIARVCGARIGTILSITK